MPAVMLAGVIAKSAFFAAGNQEARKIAEATECSFLSM